MAEHPEPVILTTIDDIKEHLENAFDYDGIFDGKDTTTYKVVINGITTYLRWTIPRWWMRATVERADIDYQIHKDEADALCAQFAGCSADEGYYMHEDYRMPRWQSGDLYSDMTPIAEAILFFSQRVAQPKQ